MTKKHIIFLLFIYTILPSILLGQERNNKYNKYFGKDQLSFSLNSTQWLQQKKLATPSYASRGINLQMMYPILGNKSNLAFAIGFGLACQNYYLSEYILTDKDSLWFMQIPDSISYTKYKLNTNYLTIPLEFRIRTNPSRHSRNSFKIYPGFRTGFMVNVHTKYIGTNLENNKKIKQKWFDIEHIATLDYGATLRVGYGKFMINAYYSLSDLIDPGKGPVITPIEIGITLILF